MYLSSKWLDSLQHLTIENVPILRYTWVDLDDFRTCNLTLINFGDQILTLQYALRELQIFFATNATSLKDKVIVALDTVIPNITVVNNCIGAYGVALNDALSTVVEILDNVSYTLRSLSYKAISVKDTFQDDDNMLDWEISRLDDLRHRYSNYTLSKLDLAKVVSYELENKIKLTLDSINAKITVQGCVYLFTC